MRSAPSLVSLLLALSVCIGASGCDRARTMLDDLRGEDEASEIDETEEGLKLEREKAELARLEAERELLEAKKAERERLEAEQRSLMLAEAETLVVKWADELEAKTLEDGSFEQHGGLTEEDPWGRPIRVWYSDTEDAESQTLEVRSAGPNGKMDDEDDVVRTRTTEIERGWWERNKLWVVIGFVWFGLGFTSAGGLTKRRHRKNGRENQGLDSTDVLLSLVHIAVAPLSMLFWLLVLIIEVIGEVAD